MSTAKELEELLVKHASCGEGPAPSLLECVKAGEPYAWAVRNGTKFELNVSKDLLNRLVAKRSVTAESETLGDAGVVEQLKKAAGHR